MLTSFQVERVFGIEKLALKAPRLREIKVLDCPRTHLRLEIVHGESIERLLVDSLEYTNLRKRYLYSYQLPWANSTFLSSLQQLKEIHTIDFKDVFELFDHKQLSGRADLKIYFWGLLLNGPDDPAMDALRGYSLSREWLVCFAENRSRLADQIPFYRSLHYSEIEDVAPGLKVDLLKRDSLN